MENVGRRYGRRWALADVNFEAREGSVIMVAGRNGSGKSTLFRVLSTAIRPDRGQAHICGFNVVREREDVRKITALLSHYSYLYESLTASENLRVVAEHLGLGRNGLMEILERVNLAQRADDTVSTFSAGMRKRLSFARVLLQQPRVVMLDEPYGQLDPEGFVLVDEVVRELKAKGTTILMATHQLERGASLADDAVLLDAGRVIWSGSARDVLAKDRKREEAC
ncbi:MAG TPA: heme ABC exporter ATP-binding protein CcmA [Thermoanaerobaculia bacterium]|nr:heme ABC exporter ATP-binding protein CcmA [Thermoanaerobaculia bacterium]